MNVIKGALQAVVDSGHNGHCSIYKHFPERLSRCDCALPLAQRALPAAEAVEGLVEALECAEYALTHKESNQQFAINAAQQALTAYKASVK